MISGWKTDYVRFERLGMLNIHWSRTGLELGLRLKKQAVYAVIINKIRIFAPSNTSLSERNGQILNSLSPWRDFPALFQRLVFKLQWLLSEVWQNIFSVAWFLSNHSVSCLSLFKKNTVQEKTWFSTVYFWTVIFTKQIANARLTAHLFFHSDGQ